jgi:hypothetical protein
MSRGRSKFVADTIYEEMTASGDRIFARTRSEKKNYAERLSRRLSQRFADALRADFKGILPDASGSGQESQARGAKGVKKLDVNYSTTKLGLGLGVSIKTINFPDGKSGRYTKNFTRADGELRAEAADYHIRQPYSVMVAVIFLPTATCEDAGPRSPSSFGSAVKLFRSRAGRKDPKDDPMLFEHVFIGLYSTDPSDFGAVGFFDVMRAPPKSGRPASMMGFREVIQSIRDVYDGRNSPVFEWADAPPEKLTEPVVDPDVLDEDEEED